MHRLKAERLADLVLEAATALAAGSDPVKVRETYRERIILALQDSGDSFSPDGLSVDSTPREFFK